VKILVTGAAGFIGRRVVCGFLREGHTVRALVRTGTDSRSLPWAQEVELQRGDVRAARSLEQAVAGVDAVVHLAGSPSADPDTAFAAFVVGTEQLIAAMARAGVRRLVLASSFAVYDMRALRSTVDERAPLERDPYSRDGYTVAKLWQERVARSGAAEHGLELTVLRPGLVWGPGETEIGSLGPRLGPVRLLFGARTTLRLTYVDNCAQCFIAAALSPDAAGETINVIDSGEVTAWRYAGALRRHGGRRVVRVVVPYGLAFGLVRVGHRIARTVLGPAPRLPGLMVPRRFEGRFKPLRYRVERATTLRGSRPAVPFEQAAALAMSTREPPPPL